MPSLPRGAVCAIAVMTGFGIACASADDPGATHPLDGVYDVVTVLDTFDYEVGATSPSQCPSSGSYCTYQRPFAGATLSGTLTLRTIGDSLAATGTFSGMFCDSYDVDGCHHVGPLAGDYVNYGSTFQVSGADSLVGVALIGEPVLGLQGKFGGDSIAGTVAWRRTWGGRYPPVHRGTFVAHRRD